MTTLTSADHLNRDCKWVTSNPKALASIPEPNTWTTMLAKHPVFVAQRHIDTMNELIQTITALSQDRQYQSLLEQKLPSIASYPTTAKGVLFGYDFHLTPHGPKLIEVNTNAGAAFFNHILNQSQQACCRTCHSLMRSPVEESKLFEDRLLDMFLNEFNLEHPGRSLKTIAIVDENPEEQFLYPEFCLFRSMFESAGIQVFIAGPSELSYDDSQILYGNTKIDLIYNRHTDFYLEAPNLEHIRSAYLKQHVVLSPNPRVYGLTADKRLMSYWSDPEFLSQLNLSQKTKNLLRNTIPFTTEVSPANVDFLWQKRKQFFFKPATGFGSRAAYNGAKLTKKTWASIVSSGKYIAQEFVPPTIRVCEHEGEAKTFKIDLRNYVYNGNNLMVSARLYRGQTTNMKTPGGGFATVYSTAESTEKESVNEW